MVVTAFVDRPVDESTRYASVETPEGRCVGRVTQEKARTRTGAYPLGGAETFSASALIGKTMRDGQSPEKGSVERVSSRPLWGNHAVVRFGATTRNVPVDYLCE